MSGMYSYLYVLFSISLVVALGVLAKIETECSESDGICPLSNQFQRLQPCICDSDCPENFKCCLNSCNFYKSCQPSMKLQKTINGIKDVWKISDSNLGTGIDTMNIRNLDQTKEKRTENYGMQHQPYIFYNIVNNMYIQNLNIYKDGPLYNTEKRRKDYHDMADFELHTQPNVEVDDSNFANKKELSTIEYSYSHDDEDSHLFDHESGSGSGSTEAHFPTGNIHEGSGDPYSEVLYLTFPLSRNNNDENYMDIEKLKIHKISNGKESFYFEDI